MTMTWCILGGGGSFGVHAALHLLENTPDTVLGIGRNPLRPEPFTLGVERNDRFAYRAFHIGHETDLLLDHLDEVQPRVIVNFAAQGEGAASWKHSWRFYDTNATALARLVEELGKRSWLERFVHIGSSEVYGSSQIAATEHDQLRPTSPYAVSKAAFDQHLLAVHKVLGFPMTILRPSNCYGPGQLLHRIIPKAIVAALLGRRIPLDGGGVAEKSYLHARDLAEAIRLVAMSNATLGKVYNVGPSRPVTIRSVVERCAAAAGVAFDDLVIEGPPRLSEDSRYWLSSSALRLAVDWDQRIDWDEGLAGMVDWGRRYLEQLRSWPTTYELRA